MWFLPDITKKPVIEQSYSHYWQALVKNKPIKVSADIRSFTACGWVGSPTGLYVISGV